MNHFGLLLTEKFVKGKNKLQEAATPIYYSFIWGRGRKMVFVALLFISMEHLFPKIVLAKDFLQLFSKAEINN